jgi:DNA polymerase V
MIYDFNQSSIQQIDVLFKENKSIKIAVMFVHYMQKQHIDDLWHPVDFIQQRQQLIRFKYETTLWSDCLQVGYHSTNPSWKMRQQNRSKLYNTLE